VDSPVLRDSALPGRSHVAHGLPAMAGGPRANSNGALRAWPKPGCRPRHGPPAVPRQSVGRDPAGRRPTGRGAATRLNAPSAPSRALV